MKYLMTGIESHIDKGFGITADAYYQSAEHLMNNHFEHYDVTQQAEMPQNFLFRHSIELYLKSLIIIFHRTLKKDYGSVAFDSDDPEVFIDGQWRKLYSSHYIDKLYEYWLNWLLLPNVVFLNQIASTGEWQEAEEISKLLPLICRYDRDSSYFRYPIIRNGLVDNEKYTMQKFRSKAVEEIVDEINKRKLEGVRSLTTLIFDESDNLIEAFTHRNNILIDIRDALKRVAFYLKNIHVMTRVTLCDGM